MLIKDALQGKRQFLLDFILQWIQGYVRIELSGSGTGRFFQICHHKNIKLWKSSIGFQKGSCYISLNNLYSIPNILRKTHVHLHISKKQGAPFFFYRYKKRKMFAIGMILCLLFLMWLSGFLWDIQIYGSNLYSPIQIQSYLTNKGLKLGYSCKKINCESIEELLREEFSDISWVSCELRGTQLIIRLKDTLDIKDKNTSESPCDLIASKDGTIYSIITRNGTPLVKKGSNVKKGEVLISGIVPILDDFDNKLETDYTNADGTIMAETRNIYKDSLPLQYYAKVPTGKKSYGIDLGLWNIHIPLLPKKEKYDTSYTIKKYYTGKLGKTFYLPLRLELSTNYETLLIQKTRTKSKAKELAKKRYYKYLQNLTEKGIKIIDNKFKISISKDSCTTIGVIHSIEPIGKIKKLKQIEKIVDES